jgi:hypothetical protein
MKSLYVKPENVHSPKARWRLQKVIFDGGPLGSETGGWSLAEGQWEDDEHVWSNALGIRWNGTAEAPLGNPHSRGQPTWFIVPAEIEDAIRKTVEKLRSR